MKTKSRWFGCSNLRTENKFVRLVHLSLQFFIWECKLKKKLPSCDDILGETIEQLDIACSINTELMFEKDNYTLICLGSGIFCGRGSGNHGLSNL